MRAMAAVCAIILAACAGSSKQVKPPEPSNQSEEAKAAAEQEKLDESKLVCTWERPTGSNIPEKVCKMPEQADAEREAAQRIIHSTHPVQVVKDG